MMRRGTQLQQLARGWLRNGRWLATRATARRNSRRENDCAARAKGKDGLMALTVGLALIVPSIALGSTHFATLTYTTTGATNIDTSTRVARTQVVGA